MSEKPEKQAKRSLFQYVFAILFGLGIGGLILVLNHRTYPETIQILPTTTPAPIAAHITGEVMNPGVYEIRTGQRISDLVELAGGFTNNADITLVNLASKIHDGQQVIIPIQQVETDTPNIENLPVRNEVTVTYPININYCSQEELMSLPGIGEVKADAIIQYRDENDGFEVVEDIIKVSGIGDTIFENIKDKITVN